MNDTTMNEETIVVSNPLINLENFSSDSNSDTFLFDENGYVEYGNLPGKYDKFQYVLFGADNQLPYVIKKLVMKDSVLGPNQYNNVVTCYGNGLHFYDKQTKQISQDKDIKDFYLRNSIPRFFLEQITDLKTFFFTVCVIVLSKDGTKIVQLRHRDACNVRFQKQNSKGVIENVFVANFNEAAQNFTDDNIEVIPLLNEIDPLTDLQVRMGILPNADGRVGKKSDARKFAMVVRFPTLGNPYYPMPYYCSIFHDKWYEIKQLIAKNKMDKLKNPLNIKYLVSIHPKYWSALFKKEGITDPEEQAKRVEKEKTLIKDFLSNNSAASKAWISGRDFNGKDGMEDLLRIDVLNTAKEGGEWSDDIQESTNIMCYATNVHPNLFGAVPGKAQTNNSGSDKRELFTMKQAMEKSAHDLLSMVFNLILEYNGWADTTYVDVPLIQLTTLDKNMDAQEVTLNNDNDDNDQ